MNHKDINNSGYPIRDLPNEIGNLGALTALNLSGCPIKTLPENIR